MRAREQIRNSTWLAASRRSPRDCVLRGIQARGEPLVAAASGGPCVRKCIPGWPWPRESQETSRAIVAARLLDLARACLRVGGRGDR
eukprot:9913817-Alexandrium_andersonii.AAC.1